MDRSRTTPFDVSARQVERSPGFEEQVTVTTLLGGAPVFGAAGPLCARGSTRVRRTRMAKSGAIVELTARV
jgi:hypothetical protein